MKLNYRDKNAMEMACNCIRNCNAYQIPPAPYFPLLIRMYRELERLGEVEWEDETPSMDEMNP